MSISLIVSGLGAVVAVIGLGVVMARCLRAPRGDLIGWAVALLGLVISLGAQALGHAMGFSAVTFRAMEIGAQLIAPFALIMGLSELAGKSVPARFCSRLFLPALAIIALVILAIDPLSGQAFSKGWPSPPTYYQIIPNKLIEYGLGPVAIIVALIAFGVLAQRASRGGPGRAVLPGAAAAFVSVIALAILAIGPALSSHLGVSLPLSSLYAVFCLLAAALTLFAGMRTERVSLASLRGGAEAERGPGAAAAAGGPGRGYDDRREDWAGQRGGNGYDTYGDDAYSGLYRDEPAGARNGPGADPGYGWQTGPDGYPVNGDYDSMQYGPLTQDGLFDSRTFGPVMRDGEFDSRQFDAVRDDFDSRQFDAAYDGDGYGGPPAPPMPPVAPGEFGRDAGQDPRAGGREPAGADADRSQLFGQIAIYTLIEDRVHEFDRLTERVVALVREREPDTLVFIVHAVPSAPMQRILYEVYRDRVAYDWHEQQPYVLQFEQDRQPYVLATNVIELGLQQAKVSPFPSIVDLFGETGYDTSGFERPDFSRDYGSAVGQGGPGGQGRAGQPVESSHSGRDGGGRGDRGSRDDRGGYDELGYDHRRDYADDRRDYPDDRRNYPDDRRNYPDDRREYADDRRYEGAGHGRDAGYGNGSGYGNDPRYDDADPYEGAGTYDGAPYDNAPYDDRAPYDDKAPYDDGDGAPHDPRRRYATDYDPPRRDGAGQNGAAR